MEYNDYELLHLIYDNDEEAKDILFQKYRYIIDILIKKYRYVAKKLGIDLSDLEQEARVGFTDAINDYSDDKKATIQTFITICVERRIRKIVIKYGRTKAQVLNESLSLDYFYDEFDSSLAEIISDNYANDPLHNIESEESFKELNKNIKNSLSEGELKVFNLMQNNLDNKEIALILNKNYKQIDNTIQRIRLKIKEIIKMND